MSSEGTNPYAQEAQERWGDTDAYQESQRRLSGYSKNEIAQAQQAMEDATLQILAAKQAGLPANSVEAMAGAEAHRASINDWWYECGYEMHKSLGEMYLLDPRFKEHYEKHQPGLAEYVRNAIFANAEAHAL